VGGSILEVDRHNQRQLGDRITSAWHAVGLPARMLTVVAAAACVAVALAWQQQSPPVVATGLSLLVLVVAALVDAVEHRLPNPLVAGAALPVVLALAVAGSADLVRSATLGAVFVAGPLLLAHLVTPAGMGFGDVKAGAVLGAAIGLIDVEVALLALVFGLGAGAAWGIGRRARSVALGPALVAGALAAALTARLSGIGPVA
jgi:leader peptidase (prepilin peptidase)/N-methyltransferase